MTTITAAPFRVARSARHRWPLAAYAGRRIVAGVITLFIATILIFLVIQILPGDVAQIVLGRNSNPQRVAEINAQLHLNASLPSRYWQYLTGLLAGNLGNSTAGLVQGVQTSVSGIVGPALAHSLELALIVMVLFVPLTLVLGVVSGSRVGGGIDHSISTTTLAISALPEFLVGTVLIFLFFTELGWFAPVSEIPQGESPFAHPNLLVLPVLTLLLVSAAFGARLLRASVAEVLTQDYITSARLNGYSQRRIISRYLLPNALVPTIQILAQQIQYLIGGIVIVEAVFNYPGIGNQLVRAISVRDVQEIMVITTILAALYISINIIADVLCVAIDPKVRTTI